MRSVSKRVLTIAAVALITSSVLADPGAAFPGARDSRFGTAGESVMAPDGANRASAVVALQDGRIVVAGSQGSELGSLSEQPAVLYGRREDGSTDPSFGHAGVATNFGIYGAVRLARRPDGKLISFGHGLVANRLTFALARHLPDGSLDSSFGVGGKTETDFGFGDIVGGSASAVTITSDGKILVAGSASRADHPDPGPLVARFLPDGALDPSFGDGGLVLVPGADAVAVQPDGKVVLGSGVTVTRLAANGAADTAFGIGGSRSFEGGGQIRGFLVQPTGRIVVLRRSWNSDGVVVTGLTPTGAFDAVFGSPYGASVSQAGSSSTSVTFVSPGYVIPASIFAQSDGRLVVTGFGNGLLFGVRFWPNGELDRSFGSLGVAFRYSADSGGAGTIAADGSILLAGTRGRGAESRALVGRVKSTGYPLGVGLVLDGWGGLHGFTTHPDARADKPWDAPYWTGWDIARGASYVDDGTGGYVVDGWGGLHRFSASAWLEKPYGPSGGPYWKGWDIVRGVATARQGYGGYVLDGWGGLHRFAAPYLPPATNGGPYWKGWDIARGVAVLPDKTGGYIVDGWGGIHPFGIGGNPPPPAVTDGPYWKGWDIVRGITILPDGSGGYVVDGWGGIHPFSIGAGPRPAPVTDGPYWRGWDIVRGIASGACGASCRSIATELP